VLLVGCGTGLDLPLLATGVEVTAFDLTPAMVRRTAEGNQVWFPQRGI
jgi:SAM-dependent methyltransferase